MTDEKQIPLFEAEPVCRVENNAIPKRSDLYVIIAYNTSARYRGWRIVKPVFKDSVIAIEYAKSLPVQWTQISICKLPGDKP